MEPLGGGAEQVGWQQRSEKDRALAWVSDDLGSRPRQGLNLPSLKETVLSGLPNT